MTADHKYLSGAVEDNIIVFPKAVQHVLQPSVCVVLLRTFGEQ